MSFEMSFEQSLKHELFQIPGIEVWENMRCKNVSLHPDYLALRKNITPGEINTICTIGLGGAAKGSLNMGFYRLLVNDVSLHDRLKEKGAELKIITVPFSAYTQAVRRKEMQKIHPNFAVPAEYQSGTFSSEHYGKISNLMSHDIEEYVLKRRNPHEAVVLIVEGSTPACYPLTDSIPVEVAGVDRGNSPIYNLALHEATRSKIHIYAIERHDDVRGVAVNWRSLLASDPELLGQAFRGPMRVIFTDRHGQEVDARDLPLEAQQDLADFLIGATAPPAAVQKSDQQFTSVLEELYQARHLRSRTQSEYFKFIRGRLDLSAKQFSICKNEPFQGDTTYEVNYLLKSLPVRLYPWLVGPELSRYIHGRKRWQIVMPPTIGFYDSTQAGEGYSELTL